MHITKRVFLIFVVIAALADTVTIASASITGSKEVAIVLNSNDDDMSLIGTRTYREIKRVPIGQEPHHLINTLEQLAHSRRLEHKYQIPPRRGTCGPGPPIVGLDLQRDVAMLAIQPVDPILYKKCGDRSVCCREQFLEDDSPALKMSKLIAAPPIAEFDAAFTLKSGGGLTPLAGC